MAYPTPRFVFLALTFCPCLAAAPQGDPQAIRNYILSEYSNVNKVLAQDFMAKAVLDGMVTSVADRIVAKQVFFELRKDKASGRGAIRFDIDRLTGGETASPFNEPSSYLTDGNDLTEEIEYNDSLPYADALEGSSFIIGSADDNGDLDYFEVCLMTSSVVIASVLPRGGSPIDDGRLLIQNELGGFVAFNDDANGTLFPTICSVMPAGNYRFAVDIFPGSSLGDYTLNLLKVPQAPGSVVLGGVTNGNITSLFGELFEFTLTESSQVSVQFTPGPLDLRMSILCEDNGTYYFVDDSSAGLDPNFDGELPAGSYFLLIDEFTGAAGTYSFQVDASASSPVLVCDGAAATGDIAGAESYRLYAINLAMASELDLVIGAGAVGPIDDTVVDLLDANLQLIASNDDDDASLLSSLQTFLPAGDYFVGVRGFGASSGSFTLSASCTPLGPAQQGLFSNNPGTVAAGDEKLYNVSIKTPNPVEILINPGTLTDPVATCVDSLGQRVLLNERGPLGEGNLGAGFLPVGDYLVTVRSENNSGAGDFGLEVRPPLWIAETAPGICDARGHHKAGELVSLFVGPSEGPPAVIFPMFLHGFLLMTSLNTGTRFMLAPEDGEYGFGEVPVVTCTIQGINFDQFEMILFDGRWTDVINIVNGVIGQ